MNKASLHEKSKETLRSKKRAVTPRIAILYLDGDRRKKSIHEMQEKFEKQELKKYTFSPHIGRQSQSPHQGQESQESNRDKSGTTRKQRKLKVGLHEVNK